MNMTTMITNLPIVDNSDVSPAESPTVPNAETTSKTIAINDPFSVIVKIRIAIKTNKKLIMVRVKALKIALFFILRPNKDTSSPPFKIVIVVKSKIINVLSLIPLPVEALPAPTNISSTVNIMAGTVSAVISIELKPAVLGVRP